MEKLNRSAFVRRNPENDRQIDVVKLPVEANYVNSSNFMQMRAKSDTSGKISLSSSVKSIEFVRAKSPWPNVSKYDDAGSVVKVTCGGDKAVYALPSDLTNTVDVTGLSPNTEYDVKLEMMDGFDQFQMAGNQYVTALSIPASMTSVGSCQGDSNLTAFCFESGTIVAMLPANMFKSTSLKNLIIPAGMSIGAGALECTGLSVKMAYDTYYQQKDLVDSLTGISVGLAFMNGDSQVKQRPSPAENRNVHELKLPASQLTAIQTSAFARYNALSSVILPGSLMSIGEDAFTECSALADCWMNDSSCNTLPRKMFRKCPSLSSIKAPGNVTLVDSEAFAQCSSLASVKIGSAGSSVTYHDNVFNGSGLSSFHFNDADSANAADGIFCMCSNLTDVDLPAGMTKVPDRAFAHCGKLRGIKLPSTVRGIGTSAFYATPAIGQISFPAGCANIGDYAFQQSGISAMSHGGWIQRIGNSAFETSRLLGLYNLSAVEIADAAFQGSEKLSVVTLFTPKADYDGLKIGDYAFAGCSALTAVTLNGPNAGNNQYDNFVSVGNGAFRECTSLKSASLFTHSYAYVSAAQIGDYAFAGCSALTAVTLGSGQCIPTVTKLGDYAFTGCSSLATLTMTNWPLLSAIGEGCFMNCSKFPSTSIQTTRLGEIQASAFCGCNGYNASPTINTAPGISVIGDSAFRNTSWNYLYLYSCADYVLIGPNAFRDSNFYQLYLTNTSKLITLSNDISDPRWDDSDAGIFYGMRQSGGVNLQTQNNKVSFAKLSGDANKVLGLNVGTGIANVLTACSFAGADGLSGDLCMDMHYYSQGSGHHSYSYSYIPTQYFKDCTRLTSITLSSSQNSNQLLQSNSKQFENCHSLQVLSLKSTSMGDAYYSWVVGASDIFAGIDHSLSIIFSSSSTALTTDTAKDWIKARCVLPAGKTLTLMKDNPGGAPEELNVLEF